MIAVLFIVSSVQGGLSALIVVVRNGRTGNIKLLLEYGGEYSSDAIVHNNTLRSAIRKPQYVML